MNATPVALFKQNFGPKEGVNLVTNMSLIFQKTIQIAQYLTLVKEPFYITHCIFSYYINRIGRDGIYNHRNIGYLSPFVYHHHKIQTRRLSVLS